MNKLDIILACEDLGVHVDGTNEGPKRIANDLKLEDTKLVEKKDIVKNHDVNNKKKNLDGVNDFNERLYKEAYNSLEKGNKILTLGGDHSLAIASALASIKKNEKMGIIWVDAHGDYNTFETTITGNLHGLPLAVIDGYEKKLLSDFHTGNNYSPKNTVIIGARDLDDLERENLKDAGVTIFTTKDIRNRGVNEIVNEAIKIASSDVNKVHISYDIDVIDPLIVPGVSIPAIDGINEEEAYGIMNRLLEHKDIINSFDIVEYNPSRDIDNKTNKIVLKLVNKVINNLL
jgi:arginase